MMKTLRETLQDAESRKVAVGHFNISNLEALWGIFRAAQKLDLPVVIGVSEGERKFVGVRQAVALVQSIRTEFDYPIFLNADHTYTVEGVQEAIDAGFDSVIFDGVKLSKEENIERAKACVAIARSSGRDVLVEAEIGYIGSSSKLLDEIPEGAAINLESLPTGDDARQFVEATGVDLLAPAVGNIHGMLKNSPNPELFIDRIREIKVSSGVPLVLHGGSGIRDANFVDAIQAGISCIHINTEIRVAFRDALKEALMRNPDEVAPYKFLEPGLIAVSKVVEERLRLFNNLQ